MNKYNLSDIFSDLDSESSIILPKSIKIKNLDTISDTTSSFMPQKGGYLSNSNDDINQLLSMLSTTSENNSTDTEQLKNKLLNQVQYGYGKGTVNFLTLSEITIPILNPNSKPNSKPNPTPNPTPTPNLCIPTKLNILKNKGGGDCLFYSLLAGLIRLKIAKFRDMTIEFDDLNEFLSDDSIKKFRFELTNWIRDNLKQPTAIDEPTSNSFETLILIVLEAGDTISTDKKKEMVNTYLTEMANTKKWGDEIIIQAFRKIIDINFVTIRETSSNQYNITNGDICYDGIWLFHTLDIHFELIFPINVIPDYTYRKQKDSVPESINVDKNKITIERYTYDEIIQIEQIKNQTDLIQKKKAETSLSVFTQKFITKLAPTTADQTNNIEDIIILFNTLDIDNKQKFLNKVLYGELIGEHRENLKDNPTIMLKYYEFIESIPITEFHLKNYIIKEIKISLYKLLIEYIKKFIIDSDSIILKNIVPFMLIRNEIQQNIINRKVIENSLKVPKQLTGPKLSAQYDLSNFNISFIKEVNKVITKNNTVLTFDENDIIQIIDLFNTLDDINKENFLNVVIYHNLIGESGRNIEKNPILIIIYYYFIKSIKPSDDQIKTIINNIKKSLYINLMNYIESYIIKDDLTIPQNNSLFIQIRDMIEIHFISAKEIFEPVFIESKKDDNSTIVVEATNYQQKAYYKFFDITNNRNVGEGKYIYDDMTISYNRKNKDQPSEDQPSEVEFNITMADSTSTLYNFTIKEFTDQISDLDYISFVVLVNTDGENILSTNNKSLTTYISKKNKPIN